MKFQKNKKHIVTTQIEHKCIFSICDYLTTLDYDITYVKPNKDGAVNAESIIEAMRPDTTLVSVMHVITSLVPLTLLHISGKPVLMQVFYFIVMRHRALTRLILM